MNLKEQRIEQFERQGLIFDVIDSGPLDGKPFILLHGFPETSKIWQQTSEILNQQGFRTYAINQRGYSLKAQPKGRFAYTNTELVADINTFLDLVDEPVYLVGHDWGAVIAWDITLIYPNKIKHLTAISVPHKTAFLKSMLSSNQLFKSYYIGLFQLPKVAEILFTKLPKIGRTLLKSSGMTESQLTDFQQEMVNEKRLSPAINWYRALPFSSNRTLNIKAKVPTLFIWGKHDVAIGKRSVELNKNYVDAPYTEIILDATHWLPTQNAKDIANIVLKDISKI